MMSRPNRQLGCWPAAAQQQLLLASMSVGDAARDAWSSWRATVNIEDLDPGSFRLLPLLYTNLRRHHVDDRWMPRLRGVYRQSWYRNQVLFRRTTRVLQVLHDAGIETLAVKGLSLSLLYYVDDGARPMSDADIVVRAADLPRSIRLMEQHGWRALRPLSAYPPPHRGSWGFIDQDDYQIDVHWHIFSDCLSDDADDDLWTAAKPVVVEGAPTKALAPADELLLALVHGIHSNPVPSIRWVPDAAAIITRAGERLDWERLLAQAAKRRFVPLVTLGLRYLRDIVAVPVPPLILARLEAVHVTRLERLDLWARMERTPLSGACRTWFGYLRSLDGTRRWPEPVGYLHYLRGLWLADSYSDLLTAARSKVAHRRTRTLDASVSQAPR